MPPWLLTALGLSQSKKEQSCSFLLREKRSIRLRRLCQLHHARPGASALLGLPALAAREENRAGRGRGEKNRQQE